MARGRPRTFDVDLAVGRALPIFLANGYEGASFAQLIAAIGINPPSFYAAFGSKEGLFRRAMDLYAARAATSIAAALSQRSAYQVIAHLLRATADSHTDPAKPPGCLFVQGALSCSEAASDIRDELAKHRSAFEAQLRRRFAQAQAAKDLSDGVDPRDLALLVSTICQGMAVQAAGGATRRTLRRLVDVTLKTLPALGVRLSILQCPR
jgi:AcrR family transcriptional regulator